MAESSLEDVTIPIRLIRSFQHRNIQYIVMKNIKRSMLVTQFLEMLKKDLKNRSNIPPPFRNFGYDTLKIEHKAYGAKTSDPVINIEDDENLILDPVKTLEACGVENETALSFFKFDDYVKYKEDKTVSW